MNFLLYTTVLILLGAGVAGAVRLQRHRRLRQQKAIELDQALLAYSLWIDQELQATVLNADAPGEPVTLCRVRALKHAYFPEFAPQMTELLMAHIALNERLWHLAVQRLKQADGLSAADDVAALRGHVDAAVGAMRRRCARISRDRTHRGSTTA